MTPTFTRIAKDYLSQRATSKAHEANVLRLAARVKHPTAAEVNAYLKKRLETRASITCRSERSILLTLWRWAWECDMVATPPKGVMRVKGRKPPTVAWTVEQIRESLKATERYNGQKLRSGAPLDATMRAWILLAYESGARFGDIWSFRAEHFRGDTLRWQQHKTGDAITKLLSPACMEAVQAMLAKSPDGTVLGWACRRRQAMRLMRTHLDSIGAGGSSKWLRRSGATHVEIASPGKGRYHLGHRSVGLFESAYADWGQIRQNAPVVPRLA
jgi:integrase